MICVGASGLKVHPTMWWAGVETSQADSGAGTEGVFHIPGQGKRNPSIYSLARPAVFPGGAGRKDRES